MTAFGQSLHSIVLFPECLGVEPCSRLVVSAFATVRRRPQEDTKAAAIGAHNSARVSDTGCSIRVSGRSGLQVPHKISVPQECPTRVSHKSAGQECTTRLFHNSVDKSVLLECPTRVSHKNIRQECPTRVSRKSAECPTRVCPIVYKSVPCPTKQSYQSARKSVPQERPARVSYKSVPQE